MKRRTRQLSNSRRHQKKAGLGTTLAISFQCPLIPIAITDEDISCFRGSIPVISYIAGYCCYSINKKLKCDECKLRLVSNDGDLNNFGNSLIKGINRGSLLYPSSAMVHIALVCFIAFQKIASHEEFLKSRCQRSQVIESIFCTLDDKLVTQILIPSVLQAMSLTI